MTIKRDYKAVAAAKQAARDARIPAQWRLAPEQIPGPEVVDVTGFPAKCGLLSPREVEITETEAVDLLEKLHSASEDAWTAVDVTTAFCKRAAIAQQLTNCLTEIFFDEALERAREIDAHKKATGKPLGPLAGLPISLKDNFLVKGHDATLGFITWANAPVESESHLVTILRSAGAVLYCKTNVPTGMMIAESVNNVWDRTLNPYNRTTSSGGSSGGEGALLAMKGAPLGVGTDIGGSIRIPAALCNLYGLRPSFGRFPTHNARSAMPGTECVNSVNGPMSPSLSALSLFCKVVCGAEPWRLDPKCVPLPWRPLDPHQHLPAKGLVFGFMRHNGVVAPTPPLVRAMEVTAAALRAAGHVVIEWQPFEHERGARILEDFFTGEGRSSILDLMTQGGEEEVWVAGLGKPVPAKTVGELRKIQSERTMWAAEQCRRWEETSKVSGGRVMDALICPASPFAGVPHDTFEHVAYTGAWNLTDWSAVTFPVLRADSSKDVINDSYKPLSDLDKRVWNSYKPEAVHGSPVALQLVGRRFEEERVLALVQRVSETLSKKAG